MELVSALVSLFGLVGIISLAFVLASCAGLLFYRAVRRSLYNRPLSAEEQWSETSEEAKNEETWMGVTSTLSRE